MVDMLIYQMQSSDETMRRQVQYIYGQLTGENEGEERDNEGEEQSDIEEEEEDDYEEDNEQENDPENGEDFDNQMGLPDNDAEFDTLRIDGVLTGEELLTSQFLLNNDEAMAQTATISKRMEEAEKEKLNKSDISANRRPVSPFGQGLGEQNPFSISKIGYANPAAAPGNGLDRSLPSAMKTRNKIPRTPEG